MNFKKLICFFIGHNNLYARHHFPGHQWDQVKERYLLMPDDCKVCKRCGHGKHIMLMIDGVYYEYTINIKNHESGIDKKA